MFGNDLMTVKKLKKEILGTDNIYSFCHFCKDYTIKEPEFNSCQKCGSMGGELDFQLDEKFGETSKFLSFSQPHWTLHQYNAEAAREYSIRKHINEISYKIEISDSLKWNIEGFIKKLIANDPKITRCLKHVCYACIFLNMRQRDPNYSLKNFSDIANMKPKAIIKYMDLIKPYFFEDIKISRTSSQRSNQENHEAFLLSIVKKINVKQLFSKEAKLELSLLNFDEEIKSIKFGNMPEANTLIPNHSPLTQIAPCQKIETRIKDKIVKYGVFLINFDKLYTIKFGKNVNNFVIGLIIVILRAFGIPITMKKICELEDISLISISRIVKEISLKIVEEYKNMSEEGVKPTKSEGLMEIPMIKENEESQEESVKESESSKSAPVKKKNEEILRKAIKHFYKKHSENN